MFGRVSKRRENERQVPNENIKRQERKVPLFSNPFIYIYIYINIFSLYFLNSLSPLPPFSSDEATSDALLDWIYWVIDGRIGDPFSTFSLSNANTTKINDDEVEIDRPSPTMSLSTPFFNLFLTRLDGRPSFASFPRPYPAKNPQVLLPTGGRRGVEKRIQETKQSETH